MLKKYLMIFLVSMVPLIELRGAVPIAVGMNLPLLPSYIICILGNMLPVPIIFFFARKVLEWGADKPVIGISWSYNGQNYDSHKTIFKTVGAIPVELDQVTSTAVKYDAEGKIDPRISKRAACSSRNTLTR